MKRVFLPLLLILTSTAIASAQTTFYYPHVVNGPLQGVIWKTTILLTNPTSGTTASGTVTFTSDNPSAGSAGSPMVLTLTDETGQSAMSSVFTFSIPAGGIRRLISDGASPYAQGFATVSASGSVSGTAIFSEFDSAGNLIGEAGVPGVAAVMRQAIFVDTINNYNIGVAYANPGTGAANIKLDLLNSQAQSVLSTTVGKVLGPGNHTAGFTSQLFPPPAPQTMAGTMQISSDVPLAAIALRFDPTFTKFTTLPPVSLASLINPALEWLQQRDWLTPLSSVARLLGALQLRIG
jgi:hypothetical protein